MQYRTGNVSVVNGSTTVTGVGTLFTADVIPGAVFGVRDLGIPYTVESVESDTQLTLSESYSGATETDAAYTISHDSLVPVLMAAIQALDIELGCVKNRLAQRYNVHIGE